MTENAIQGIAQQVAGRRRTQREKSHGASENAALRKRIGERFRTARHINGWGQTEASEMFGYRNSTQLSLIEDGKRMPPIDKIIKAHEIYGVSVDYLCGVSDEPERDPKLAERQAMVKQLQKMFADNATLMATQFQVWLNQGAPAVASSRRFLTQAEECTRSIERFRQLNSDAFEGEMRGAATVLLKMDELNREILNAKAILDRNDRLGESIIATATKRAGSEYPLFPDQMG